MTKTKYSETERDQALKIVSKGKSSTFASLLLGIPKGTIDSWVKRFAGSTLRLRSHKTELTPKSLSTQVTLKAPRWWTPKQVCELLDISYRQLQYWDRTGLVVADKLGSSRRRRYDLDTIRLLMVCTISRNRGYSIQVLRGLVPKIQKMWAEAEHLGTGPEHVDFYLMGDQILASTGTILGIEDEPLQFINAIHFAPGFAEELVRDLVVDLLRREDKV